MARHDVKVNIVASIDCQRLLTDAALACFTTETGTITKIKVAKETLIYQSQPSSLTQPRPL
ncbi:hypothetical protein LBW59_22040 [Ralstonia solanacearum]|uniref:Uncharacterized protein n=1 Tax=Ralstonia solanacearum TaxID=305 RepID=A0AAW5ZVM1_RALSL|nr:hypothetical protein [Ralstonia solanacearum]MDB0573433.1 hypothetical protein [Ralstonia solanacearum]